MMINENLLTIPERIVDHLTQANISAAILELQNESIFNITTILNNIGEKWRLQLFDDPQFMQMLQAKIHHPAHLSWVMDILPPDKVLEMVKYTAQKCVTSELNYVLTGLSPDLLCNYLTNTPKKFLRDNINTADLLRKYLQLIPTLYQQRLFLEYLNTDERGQVNFHVRSLLLSPNGFQAYYAHKHKASDSEEELLNSYLSSESIKLDNADAIAMALDQLPSHRQEAFINKMISSHGPRFLVEKIHNAFQLNSILNSIRFANCKRKFLDGLNYQGGDGWIQRLYAHEPKALKQSTDLETLQKYLTKDESLTQRVIKEVACKKVSKPILRISAKGVAIPIEWKISEESSKLVNR